MPVKRTSFLLLTALVAAMFLGLAACGPSPKARADEYIKYLPATIGDWSRDDKQTVKLLSSTISSQGHVIMVYGGPGDATAYLDIETYPSVDAAQVAIAERERDLLLRGLEFSKDRAPRQVTADVAQDARVRYALIQNEEIVVEIDVLAASTDSPVSDDTFDPLLTAVRVAYAQTTTSK
jgi:hypothetical protein